MRQTSRAMLAKVVWESRRKKHGKCFISMQWHVCPLLVIAYQILSYDVVNLLVNKLWLPISSHRCVFYCLHVCMLSHQYNWWLSLKANTVGGGGKYYTAILWAVRSFLVYWYWMIVRPVLIRASVIVTTICDCWESKGLQGTPWIPGNLTLWYQWLQAVIALNDRNVVILILGTNEFMQLSVTWGHYNPKRQCKGVQ